MIERKTAIITGAASGMGLETARRFSRDPKYNPIFAVDKDPSVNTIFQSMEAPNIVPLQLDLRDRAQITEMLGKAAESGRLDIIVNAAGVIIAGKPSTYLNKDGGRNQELIEMDAINVAAPIIVMYEASEIMKKNGGGTIVNITSSKYLFPDLFRLQYMDGKKLVSKMTRKFSKEFGEEYGIRLVDVQPGNTRTNIDRGIWTKESGNLEMDTVQGFNDWWREKFGNDPKNVAEVIYKISEGDIGGSVVLVGSDAKFGKVMQRCLPLPILRWEVLFFLGSLAAYKTAEGINFVKKNVKALRKNNL